MGTIGTQVGILRGRIIQRRKINPSDIELIRTLYQQWINHSHTYWDQEYVRFGNSPVPYGTRGNTRTTNAVRGAPNDPTPIQAGPESYDTFADEIFELITNFNNFVYTHDHEFTDVSL